MHMYAVNRNVGLKRAAVGKLCAANYDGVNELWQTIKTTEVQESLRPSAEGKR